MKNKMEFNEWLLTEKGKSKLANVYISASNKLTHALGAIPADDTKAREEAQSETFMEIDLGIDDAYQNYLNLPEITRKTKDAELPKA